MRDSFIFYKSFYDAAAQAPNEALQNEILRHLVEVCLGMKTVDEIPFPASAVAVQALASVESAKRRYDKSAEIGAHGGRPGKVVLEEEAMPLFEQYHSWKKVAEELEVDVDTLRKYRYSWQKKDRKTEKPKNHNVYDSVSVSVSESDYVSDSDKRNSNMPSQPPAGAIAPPSAPDVKKEERWIPPPLPTD